jgi:hypothetical protein
MADIGLSAFALFFMGSPSFLAHQRPLEEGHGRSNCQTLFGIAAIPTDAYIRLMLDGAPTAPFDPPFFKTIERTAAWNTSTLFSALPSSPSAINRSCRCHRSSSPPRTERRSRTANATPLDGKYSDHKFAVHCVSARDGGCVSPLTPAAVPAARRSAGWSAAAPEPASPPSPVPRAVPAASGLAGPELGDVRLSANMPGFLSLRRIVRSCLVTGFGTSGSGFQRCFSGQ